MRARRVITVIAALVLAVAALGSAPSGANQPRAGGWWFEQSGAAVAVNGTYTPVVGDFAVTNTRDDIIWYAPGAGVEQVWISLNDGTFAKQKLQQQVNGTYTPIVGDFGGDELDDIFWYGPGTKPDVLWISIASHTFESKPVTVNGTFTPKVLDDTLGKDDIVWARVGGGAGAVWSFQANATYLNNPFSTVAGQQLLTGYFDGNGCQDVFLYGPGSVADSMRRMNCSGQASVTSSQTVNGTFTPVVTQFSSLEDGPPSYAGFDDILWFRSPGTSVLWESKGDNTWATSPHTLGAGTPLVVESEWGLGHLYNGSAPDKVWYDNSGVVPDYYLDAENTEIPAGYTPIIGEFVGTGGDIFWYKPGAAPEYLFY